MKSSIKQRQTTVTVVHKFKVLNSDVAPIKFALNKSILGSSVKCLTAIACVLVQVSLDSLMSTLRSTNVHYIRCIKPNSSCQPGIFDKKQVPSTRYPCISLSLVTSRLFIASFSWFA